MEGLELAIDGGIIASVTAMVFSYLKRILGKFGIEEIPDDAGAILSVLVGVALFSYRTVAIGEPVTMLVVGAGAAAGFFTTGFYRAVKG